MDRAPEPDRTGVNGDVRARVGSPDDQLEVYVVNPDGSLQGPMWRLYLEDGLEPPEMPLFSQFKKAVEAASKKSTTNQANP